MNLIDIRKRTEKFYQLSEKIIKDCNKLEQVKCFDPLARPLPPSLNFLVKRRKKLSDQISRDYSRLLKMKSELLESPALQFMYPETLKMKQHELEGRQVEVYTRIILCQNATLLKLLPDLDPEINSSYVEDELESVEFR